MQSAHKWLRDVAQAFDSGWVPAPSPRLAEEFERAAARLLLRGNGGPSAVERSRDALVAAGRAGEVALLRRLDRYIEAILAFDPEPPFAHIANLAQELEALGEHLLLLGAR